MIETDDLSVSGDRTPKSVSKLKQKGKQNEVYIIFVVYRYI